MSNYKTLQRRLAHLERRAGINADPPMLVMFKVVGVNDPNCAKADGRVWRREPGETGEDFEERVTADARKHDPPLKSFISFTYAKEHDPNFNPGTSSSGSDA